MLPFLFSGLALFLILLSACSTTGNTNANTSTVLPMAAVSSDLKNQGETELQTFQQWITLMQQNKGNVDTYQQQYEADQQALNNAKTDTAYKAALATLSTHVQGIQIPAMKAECLNLQQQLATEVADFGKKQVYHNDYDNTNYPLGYEYGPNGIGGWVQDELNAAKTLADYQQAVEDLQMYLANFQALTHNFTDKTPYNQVHQTDMQLMQHYGYMDRKVVVVSLTEQAVRVYDHGKLVNAFLATTGRPSKPTPPGTWWVEGKQSPTVFKASVPKSSPYWYPDTPINYAMQYHSDGYYIHDSWWRTDYGPGTNYPHADSSGDTFSAQGSHGCVNLSKDNAGWLYNFVVVYTRVMIY
jgi:lipoprotein-anchoring transpeptidase ErfK/SrfK